MVSETGMPNPQNDLDWLLDQVMNQPFTMLNEVQSDRPGAYVLVYSGPLPFYRRLWRPDSPLPLSSAGGYPIYVGKARRGLRLRMTEHIRNLDGVRSVRPNHLRVLTLTAEIPAQAGYFEELLMDEFRPIWCQRSLAGFGSMPPGRNRVENQSPAPWSVLHPGRRGTPLGSPMVGREQLISFISSHLEMTVPDLHIAA